MTTFQSQPGGNGSVGQGQEHHQGFGARVDQIGSSAQQLWSEARGAVQDLSQTLDVRGRVQRHPYGTLLAAAGIGYVLGGGLFSPLTARILRLGIRLAALPLVKDELLGIAEAAISGITSGTQQQGGGGSQNPGA